MDNQKFEQINLDYRSKTDYKLDKTKPILLMLDGRAFSKFTKQFDSPFDYDFVEMMNETAKYLCANIQNAVYAFVQSDEISIYLKPCEELTEPWFGGRISKICSVAASMASAFFTAKYIAYKMEVDWSNSYVADHLASLQIPSFDCKAWNVPTYNEVVDWFVYRQKDCIRNSKQQFAQAYCSYKELVNKTVDEQIKFCFIKTGEEHNWVKLPNGLKYGRLIRKTTKEITNPLSSQNYTRSVWEVKDVNNILKHSI